MITFSIELDNADMVEAFKQARQQAHDELYRWDFSVTLLNVAMLVDEDKGGNPTQSFIFNFQATR